MNKGRVIFIFACPHCKHGSEIEPNRVTTYIGELSDHYKGQFKKIDDMLQAAQEEKMNRKVKED